MELLKAVKLVERDRIWLCIHDNTNASGPVRLFMRKHEDVGKKSLSDSLSLAFLRNSHSRQAKYWHATSRPPFPNFFRDLHWLQLGGHDSHESGDHAIVISDIRRAKMPVLMLARELPKEFIQAVVAWRELVSLVGFLQPADHSWEILHRPDDAIFGTGPASPL